MKRALAALLLAAALTLSGCSSMLNQTYVWVEPAEQRYPPLDTPSVIEVQTRSELTSVILELVRQGVEHGVVRLKNYYGDVEADLSQACLEVAKEDPLGAYMVEGIKHDCSHIISYYEANIYISYRRGQGQVSAISRVTGSSAIRTELRSALMSFAPEVVLHVSYFVEDHNSIQELIRQAYYETPIAALGMPAATVALYPEQTEGYQRVVEIQLAYAESTEVLRQKSQQLADAAQAITSLVYSLEPDEGLERIHSILTTTVAQEPKDPAGDAPCNTAWHALVEKRSDSEGIALAMALFCQRLGRECIIVAGTLDGEPHFWNVVRLNSGEYRHVDATRTDGFSLSDADLLSQGYSWDRENGSIPLCGEQPHAGEGRGMEEELP